MVSCSSTSNDETSSASDHSDHSSDENGSFSEHSEETAIMSSADERQLNKTAEDLANESEDDKEKEEEEAEEQGPTGPDLEEVTAKFEELAKLFKNYENLI